MTFWYHMKGSKMGTLNIYTEGTTTAKSIIWTRSGSQGNDWVKGKVNITAMHGLKVSSLLNCFSIKCFNKAQRVKIYLRNHMSHGF